MAILSHALSSTLGLHTAIPSLTPPANLRSSVSLSALPSCTPSSSASRLSLVPCVTLPRIPDAVVMLEGTSCRPHYMGAPLGLGLCLSDSRLPETKASLSASDP